MRRAALMAVAALLTLGSASTPATEDFRNGLIHRYVETNIEPWLADPAIISLLKTENTLHAALRQGDIDVLDELWRKERESGHYRLIQSVLGNATSRFLQQKSAQSLGVITEILLMDSRGLNVAVSGVPSDYWQGDELKFQRSFEVGAGALFIDQPEKDESTQVLQSQVSITLTDETGAPIGAITVGINLDYL